MRKEEARSSTIELSDDELVGRSTNGDKDAYRLLVERYQARVFAIAYEIVKSREDAEDITQESFVKAFFSLGSFKRESAFFTWLYRIVHNMALDVRRKLVRRGGPVAEYDESKGVLANDATASVGITMGQVSMRPDDDLVNKEKANFLQKAMLEISEEHRSVVVLREIDGLSYDEIARITGVSKGTVMSRLFYARKKLQQALLDYAPPTGDASAVSSSIE